MKTKEELIAGIIDAIKNAPLLDDPTEIDSTELIDMCFQGNFCNRIKTVIDRISPEGPDKILEYCRSRGAEFHDMQSRHTDDIRQFKNAFVSNKAVNNVPLYPCNVHVTSEQPLRFGIRLSGFDTDMILNGVTVEKLKELLASIPGLDMVADDYPVNDIRCPVCGSNWQLFGDNPIVHCAKCNSHWVLYTRRLLGCSGFMDPVSLAHGKGHAMQKAYLENTGYELKNPTSIERIKRVIHKIPGDKVVKLVGTTGKYAGWHMTFIVNAGSIANEPHFDECVDQTLVSCNYSGDRYIGNACSECMSIVIRTPKCTDADLEELSAVAGTKYQVPCDTYNISMVAGRLVALDVETLANSYRKDEVPGDHYADLARLCPWFNDDPQAIGGESHETSGITIFTGYNRKIVN